MILKKLVLQLLLVSNLVLAQEFKGLPIENHSKQLLDSKFKSYQLLELNVGAIQTALNTRSNTHQLLISASPLNWDLTLTEYDLFKKDFYVSISSEKGVVKKNDKAGIKTYKAISNTKRTGLSCLTIKDHFIYGFVEEAGAKTYIEPLRYFANQCCTIIAE